MRGYGLRESSNRLVSREYEGNAAYFPASGFFQRVSLSLICREWGSLSKMEWGTPFSYWRQSESCHEATGPICLDGSRLVD